VPYRSNPFEVIKTRLQLQGELQAKGTYQRYKNDDGAKSAISHDTYPTDIPARHYRSVLHAAWTIARLEGVGALQKGLGPALVSLCAEPRLYSGAQSQPPLTSRITPPPRPPQVYQFVMNGLRLGTYQSLVNAGLTRNANGESEFWRTVVAGAVAGALGGVVASPLYMVKTHLQAMSRKEIAVGHQHEHRGAIHALRQTYRQHGLRGLWRGWNGAVPRLMVRQGGMTDRGLKCHVLRCPLPSSQDQDRLVSMTHDKMWCRRHARLSCREQLSLASCRACVWCPFSSGRPCSSRPSRRSRTTSGGPS
jgi:hypothetical protein